MLEVQELSKKGLFSPMLFIKLGHTPYYKCRLNCNGTSKSSSNVTDSWGKMQLQRCVMRGGEGFSAFFTADKRRTILPTLTNNVVTSYAAK